MSHGVYRLRNWNQFLRPSPTKVGDECPTASKHAVRASIIPPQKINKNKIKCLQEKLAFVRSWYVHETPAASKEI